jgi:hypothetical protein
MVFKSLQLLKDHKWSCLTEDSCRVCGQYNKLSAGRSKARTKRKVSAMLQPRFQPEPPILIVSSMPRPETRAVITNTPEMISVWTKYNVSRSPTSHRRHRPGSRAKRVVGYNDKKGPSGNSKNSNSEHF